MNVHNHSTSVYTRFVLENNNRTIVLKNSTINDTGVYVCVAENRYGKDEKSTSITIAGNFLLVVTLHTHIIKLYSRLFIVMDNCRIR